jgi:hypothetical protein
VLPAAALDVAVAWNVLLVYVRFRLIPAISLGSTSRLAAAANASTVSPEKNCEARASTCESTLLKACVSALLRLPETATCIFPMLRAAASDEPPPCDVTPAPAAAKRTVI